MLHACTYMRFGPKLVFGREKNRGNPHCRPHPTTHSNARTNHGWTHGPGAPIHSNGPRSRLFPRPVHWRHNRGRGPHRDLHMLWRHQQYQWRERCTVHHKLLVVRSFYPFCRMNTPCCKWAMIISDLCS